MVDFMHKALPAYTEASAAEHPSKYDVVKQESDTPVEVTPKRESRHDDDAETIDLRELGTAQIVRDKQYRIRKEVNTLMIGNSVVEVDTPGVITVKRKHFKLTKGL
jgi:hypothetical protein